jgi:hypothetical protein
MDRVTIKLVGQSFHADATRIIAAAKLLTGLLSDQPVGNMTWWESAATIAAWANGEADPICALNELASLPLEAYDRVDSILEQLK